MTGKAMIRYLVLLRGINVGGKNLIPMAGLKQTLEELGFAGVATYLQSGNVVFKTAKSNRAPLAKELEAVLGVEAKVILRNADELRRIIEANPMPEEAQRGPSHYIVTFLDARPAAAAMQSLRDAYSGPEKMELRGTELYIEYGSGMGQSKLTNALIERKLGVTGTARNWNTVTKLLEIAEALR